jgi:hypothetical protein
MNDHDDVLENISSPTSTTTNPYAHLLEETQPIPNQNQNPKEAVFRGKVATRLLKQMRLFPDNPKLNPKTEINPILMNAGRGKVVTRPLQRKRPLKSNPINPKIILLDTITEPDGVLKNRPSEPITTRRLIPDNPNPIQ